MLDITAQERLVILQKVQVALKESAGQAESREASLIQRGPVQEQQWIDWDTQWQARLQRLGQANELLKTAGQKAGIMVKETEDELEQLDSQLRDWMKQAEALCRQ